MAGSATDRMRGVQERFAQREASWHERIDRIEEIEAKSVPIVERELADREYSVNSLEVDADALKKFADDVVAGNIARPPKKPAAGSGDGAGANGGQPQENPQTPNGGTGQ